MFFVKQMRIAFHGVSWYMAQLYINVILRNEALKLEKLARLNMDYVHQLFFFKFCTHMIHFPAYDFIYLFTLFYFLVWHSPDFLLSCNAIEDNFIISPAFIFKVYFCLPYSSMSYFVLLYLLNTIYHVTIFFLRLAAINCSNKPTSLHHR